MKKFVFGSIFFALVGLCSLYCVLCGAQILWADMTEFTIQNAQKIDLTIDGVEPTQFSRIRYFDGAIFIIDQGGQKVIQHKNGQNKVIHETKAKTAEDKNTQPFDIVSFGEQYLISTTTLFVNYIDSENSTNDLTLSNYKYGSALDGVVSPPQALASDAAGVVYMLNNDKVLYFDKTETLPTLFSQLTIEDQPLQFSSGGFCITEDGQTIYFSIDDTIYSLDTATKTITQVFSSEDLSNINYLTADNTGNLYVKANSTIYKLANKAIIASVALNDNIVSFDFDLINGKIYYISDQNEAFCADIKSADGGSFLTNYSAIPAPVKLTNIAPKSEAIDAVVTKSSTKLYKYKTLLSPCDDYEIGKNLIILDAQDTDFYYIFDNNAQNDSGFALGYILKSACSAINDQIPSEFIETGAGKVITGITKVFLMPISQPIATDTYISSFGLLKYSDVVQILESPILTPDSNGATFVAIKYPQNGTDYIGYVDSRTLVCSELTSKELKSVPNATTKTETIIFAEKNCFNKIDILTKGSQVKIVSSNADVSKIEYYVYDGETEIVKTGYCKTSFLDTGVLSTAQIVGLVLAITSIVITVVVLLVLKRRKKRLSRDDVATDFTQN